MLFTYSNHRIMDNKILNNITAIVRDIDLKPKGTPNIDQGERFLSIAAGSFLLYKSLKNMLDHPVMALQGAAAGGLLLYRGATGVCPLYRRLDIDTTDPEAINISEHITVNVPREKVYAFWRDLSNLPKFMSHLKQVTELDANKSIWAANIPGNLVDLEWQAEITHEEQGRYIGWQSTAEAIVQNAGKVTFSDALNHIHTEIHVEISYFPPAGSVGRGLASLFNGIFEKMILSDIQQFRDYVEQADFRAYVGLEPVTPLTTD